MSEPRSTCTVCGRSRDPQLHMRGAGHPVRKAEAALKRACKRDGKPCQFIYRAGIKIGGPASGQC